MKLNVNSPGYVVAFAAGIAAAFTAAVMAVQMAARPTIERNEALREERALARIFAAALGETGVDAMADQEVARLVAERIDRDQAVRDPATGREIRLFRAWSRDRKLVGVGFPIAGNGFWAPIRGYIALTADLSEVLGIAFLDHSETPGLGGRITEEAFQKQFAGLRVAPPAPGAQFLYISRERPAGPQDPRHNRTVDAITGATQTSMAVERFLNANLEQFRRAWHDQAGVPRAPIPAGG